LFCYIFMTGLANYFQAFFLTEQPLDYSIPTIEPCEGNYRDYVVDLHSFKREFNSAHSTEIVFSHSSCCLVEFDTNTRFVKALIFRRPPLTNASKSSFDKAIEAGFCPFIIIPCFRYQMAAPTIQAYRLDADLLSSTAIALVLIVPFPHHLRILFDKR
jgi:hypothetical protein